MIKAGGGSIVNIGSGVAYMGFTRAQYAYTASRGALISLTRSLAIVYGKQNIRANIIHIGPVDTMMQKEWDEETKKEISEWVPWAGWLQPKISPIAACFSLQKSRLSSQDRK